MSLKSILGPVTSERVAEALNAGMNPKSLRARLMLLNTYGLRAPVFAYLGGYLLCKCAPYLFYANAAGQLLTVLVFGACFVAFLLCGPAWLRHIFDSLFGDDGSFFWLKPLSETRGLCQKYVDGLYCAKVMRIEGAPTEPIPAVNRVLYGADLANVNNVRKAQIRVRELQAVLQEMAQEAQFKRWAARQEAQSRELHRALDQSRNAEWKQMREELELRKDREACVHAHTFVKTQ